MIQKVVFFLLLSGKQSFVKRFGSTIYFELFNNCMFLISNILHVYIPLVENRNRKSNSNVENNIKHSVCFR